MLRLCHPCDDRKKGFPWARCVPACRGQVFHGPGRGSRGWPFALAIVFVTVLAPAAETVQWTISDSSESPSTADPPPADSIRDAFTRSYEQETAKNYRQAIQSLEPLLDQAGQEYLVNLRLGWLHYLNADYGNAVRCYRAAIEAAPQATEPRVGYLLPLLAQQHYDEAEKAARQVIELDPANYYANLRLAYALRLQGKLPEAEQVAKKMLKLQPTDVSLLSELALVYVAQDRKGEARETFEQILMLSPTNRPGSPAAGTARSTARAGRGIAAERPAGCRGADRRLRLPPEDHHRWHRTTRISTMDTSRSRARAASGESTDRYPP